MNKIKTDTLLLMLMGIVILLMVMNAGLFVRMNQLQTQVVGALQPFQRTQGLAVGTIAPSFRLVNTDGQLVALQEFSGTRTLLVFSSTTCPICQQMYPVLKQFHEKYPAIAMVMISRGSESDHRRLVQETGLTFPILNWQDEVAQAYQVPGTPFFNVIDPGGVITGRGSANSLEQLEGMVKPSK